VREAMRIFLKKKGAHSAFQNMEVVCTLLEKNIFEYFLSFEITKRLIDESYFEKSNLYLKKTLIKKFDDIWYECRSKVSKKTSSLLPAELERLKIVRGDKIAKAEYSNIMIRSCERLYELPEKDRDCFVTLLAEAMLWRDLGKRIKYSGQDYLIYTASVAWWAGQILGVARTIKLTEEDKSKKNSNIPKRSAAEFRNLVMEEADKLLIQSPVFGKKNKLRETYVKNVRSRLPELKEGYDRGEPHILAELRLGLKKRKGL
jgi:hypothetical protein